MRNKKEIAQEIFKIIKEDSKAAFTFFHNLKEKNETEIFVDLANVGVFNKEQLPRIERTSRGYTQPLWAQSIYLEYVANHVRENHLKRDDIVVKTLLEVLINLTANKENSTVVSSVFKSFSLLPSDVITCEEISIFFRYATYEKGKDIILEYAIHEGFDNFLDTINDNLHSRNTFKCWVRELFGSRDEKNSFGTREDLLFFDNYKLREFEKKHFNLEELHSRGRSFLIHDSLDVFELLLNNLLISEGVDEGSTYWRPAIEEHVQNRFHNSAQSVYVGVLFKLINFLSKNEKAQVDKIKSLMDSKFITANRIYIALVTDNPTIYCINECAEKIIAYGLSFHIRHEAYHFFHTHFSCIEINVQEKILDAIEVINEDEYANDENEKIQFIAWSKIRWLQAIKDSGNERAKKLFEKYFKITKNEAEHPDFSSYMSGGWVGPTSPWSKEDFSKAEPLGILNQLKQFEKTDDFRSPTKEGLSRTLEDYVVEDPMKISVLVDQLDELDPIYVSAIFDGYAKAWSEKKHTPVKRLLEKIKEIIGNEKFFKKFLIKESKELWTVNSTLRFIKTGVRDDENAFDPDLNDLCFEVIKLIAEKVKPTGDYVSPADAYTRAINEPRGVLFETAILWALREARLAGDNKELVSQAWMALYGLIKEPLESKALNEISLHALIGAYYRQFLFLNRAWLLENLNLIAPIEDKYEPLWVAFMEGFGYVTAFIKDVYVKLYDYGILLKFLRYESSGAEKDSRLDRLQGRVVELSLIAYVLGVEELDTGIMGEIIKSREPFEWKKLINSIVPITGNDPKNEHKDRVKLLISKLLNEYQNSSDEKSFNEHFSNVSGLLEVIDDIEDENVKTIIGISSRNSEGSWSLSDLIDFLHDYRRDKPVVVGKLFKEILTHSSSVPTYPEDKIRAIFESIKSSGDTILFSEICRFYEDSYPGYKGLDGLR